MAWKWERHTNGKMEIEYTHENYVTGSFSASGQIYVANNTVNWQFPIPFIDDDLTVFGAMGNYPSTLVWVARVAWSATHILSMIFASSGTASRTMPVQVKCEGKWK